MRCLAQLVKLVNDDNFEGLLLGFVELLRTCDLFDELLNDYSIVVVGLTWSHFQMIDGGEHNATAGSGGSRGDFVLFLLRLDLVDSGRVVESLQDSLGQSTLTRARRTVEKDVWEIIALGQLREHVDSLSV